MAKGSEVLKMLVPEGGWVIYGDDFDTIRWDLGTASITKEQFEAGFAQVDVWKAQQETAQAAKRQALLERLGITEEEVSLLTQSL